MITEAVDHALADAQAWRCGWLTNAAKPAREFAYGNLSRFERKLPASMTALNPVIQVKIAWANIALLRPAAAIEALDRADAALATGTVDAAQADAIGLAVTTARSCNTGR